MSQFIGIVAVGILATAILDVWSLLLNRAFGMPLPNWAMVGRWFGHLARGVFLHRTGIAGSPPIAGEAIIGWIGHYGIGILFALALLVRWPNWLQSPTLLPGLVIGWLTILCGWWILSPGMGNGLAHARTANPMRARLLNIVGHTVFGFGLFAGGLIVSFFI